MYNQEKLNLTALKRLTGLHPTRINVIVAELTEQHFLEKVHHQHLQDYQLTAKKAKLNLERYENQWDIKNQELENMMVYGKQQISCLMAYLRQNLGDIQPQLCGQCNVRKIAEKKQIIVPFTIAAIKWRLGKPGMI